MPKRLPIAVAREVAEKHDLRQVLVIGWDGEFSHLVTFGKSQEDKAIAAQAQDFWAGWIREFSFTARVPLAGEDPGIPHEEGFWWGQWHTKSPGTADPDDPPGDEWEVMHVVENTLDEDDDGHLMVMVPGASRWQPLENFNWGERLAPPIQGGRACRQCGCTEWNACVTDGVPCHWVEPDLCSACAGKAAGES
jgi:hypothetical protein